MSNMAIGLLCLVLFFIIALCGLKIGSSLLVTSALGIFLMSNPSGTFTVLAGMPFSTIASYDYAVLPLFILMAQIIVEAGMGKDLFSCLAAFLGHMRGGLAIATIGACAIFAAVTAFPWAAIVSIGAIAMPQMQRYQYSNTLTLGSVAAGSELGDLIPPSGMFIIYGVISGTSIGALFMAGIVPGIVLAILYIIVIAVICRIRPESGPRSEKIPMKERLATLKLASLIIVLVILILGGLFAGFFTPTEAGAVGAFGALLIALAFRRLNLQKFKNIMLETAKTVGMIYFLIFAAVIFKQMFSMSTVPTYLGQLVAELELPGIAVICIITLMYIIMGCFIDTVAMILVTTTIFLPIVESCGYSAIWYGVLLIRMGDIGGLTPPFGMTAFFLKGIRPELSTGQVFKSIRPFYLADLASLILIILFPALCDWLPAALGYVV